MPVILRPIILTIYIYKLRFLLGRWPERPLTGCPIVLRRFGQLAEEKGEGVSAERGGAVKVVFRCMGRERIVYCFDGQIRRKHFGIHSSVSIIVLVGKDVVVRAYYYART